MIFKIKRAWRRRLLLCVFIAPIGLLCAVEEVCKVLLRVFANTCETFTEAWEGELQ